MAIKRVHNLSLELNEKTLTFFPEAIGKEETAFYDAIRDRMRSIFLHLDGFIQTLTVSERSIQITWQEDHRKQGYLDGIANILTKGNYADGILLLELFLSEEPENTDLLYNLGMAYSDLNKLDRAIELLFKVVAIEPGHVNGHVALGVAYLRDGKTEFGVVELKAVACNAPENLWAQRNLGAGLMRLERYSEAVEHLRRATEIDPGDQHSWYGYGQALEASGEIDDADEAYQRSIEIDEFNKVAELARQGRSRIARSTFRSATPGVERLDATMYLVSALEKFAKFTADQVQKIGFEIAILGTRGLDINNPDHKYTLRSMEGKFSGLQLLCLEYAAFKQFAPEKDIGFDLAAEYHTALALFQRKSGEEK